MDIKKRKLSTRQMFVDICFIGQNAKHLLKNFHRLLRVLDHKNRIVFPLATHFLFSIILIPSHRFRVGLRPDLDLSSIINSLFLATLFYRRDLGILNIVDLFLSLKFHIVLLNCCARVFEDWSTTHPHFCGEDSSLICLISNFFDCFRFLNQEMTIDADSVFLSVSLMFE